MALASQESGRIAQRKRTKDAIVSAAVAAMRRGQRPSVAEAAQAADVSRRTAYRYFPSQDLLLSEAALQSMVPDVQAHIGNPSDPIEKRVERMVRATMAGAYRNEFAIRTLVRLSTDAGPNVPRPFRGSRRVALVEVALAPVKARLRRTEYRRLVNALCLVTGAEALIVLRDICGLDERRSTDAAVWSALALLRDALKGARRR